MWEVAARFHDMFHYSNREGDMNNKVRILSMSCFWIVKVFQHSQWQLTWSCMDKNHILKKNWPHPLPDPTAGTGGNGNRSNASVPSLLVTTPIRRIPGDIKMASPTVQISPNECEPFDIEFPPIKRPCRWSLKLITWDTYCLKCLWYPLVFFGVQGRRDKKGTYTTWIALSWTENFEQFLMQ